VYEDVTRSVVGIEDEGIERMALTPLVAPNPFGFETSVRFGVARRGPVSVTIHDVEGRLVRTLSAGKNFESGVGSIRWDGRDDRGNEVVSGVYLCRVRTHAQATTTRMVLLRAQ
jgi:hypothetical protein